MPLKVYICVLCLKTLKSPSDLRHHIDNEHDLRHPTEITRSEMEKLTDRAKLSPPIIVNELK